MTALAGVSLLYYGPSYMDSANLYRLDAVAACVFLLSITCFAARHCLSFVVGSAASAWAALVGYFLLVWRWQFDVWELYTVPAALFMFVWAWRLGVEKRETWGLRFTEARVNHLVLGGSALAVLPSFLQALPNNTATDPSALIHFYGLWAIGLALVLGAMWSKRKIPLLFGSLALVLGTMVKAVQWAAERQVMLPVLGILFGFVVLGLGCLFETRMNRAIRDALDKARAEAKLFWVSWR